MVIVAMLDDSFAQRAEPQFPVAVYVRWSKSLFERLFVQNGHNILDFFFRIFQPVRIISAVDRHETVRVLTSEYRHPPPRYVQYRTDGRPE